MAAIALQEWRRYPLLPIAAALGYATNVIYIWSLGPFIEPIQHEFGWTRTQVTIGLTIATLVQSVGSVPVGMLVDRIGARQIGMVGVFVAPAAFALFGLATGETTNWYLLWVLMAFAILPVQSTVWSSTVAANFSASRGMALAVALCGSAGVSALFPWLATKLIAAHGWREAFMYQAAIWAAVAAPMVILFFRGARDKRQASGGGTPQSAENGMTFLQACRSSAYIRLLIAGFFFTATVPSMTVHFVPMLTDSGMTPIRAAEITALIGLSAIVGRLATGLLLDRFPASMVGAVVFLIPVFACFAIVTAGIGATTAIVLAIALGLTQGAEIDVITYLTTRHFGLRSFGALYGGVMVALSLGTAFGSLLAANVFDAFGSYIPFLWLTIGLMVASSIAIGTLKQPEEQANAQPAPAH